MKLFNINQKDLILNYYEGHLISVDHKGVRYKVIWQVDDILWVKQR